MSFQHIGMDDEVSKEHVKMLNQKYVQTLILNCT